MAFVRQLSAHSAPITCVAINDLTGDIVTAAGSRLYVWSINGQPIAQIETVSDGSHQSILSICMSQINEWDPANVILTGGTDGVVKIWNVEYNRKYNDELEVSNSEAVVEAGLSPKESAAPAEFNETLDGSTQEDSVSSPAEPVSEQAAVQDVTDRVPEIKSSENENPVDEKTKEKPATAETPTETVAAPIHEVAKPPTARGKLTTPTRCSRVPCLTTARVCASPYPSCVRTVTSP